MSLYHFFMRHAGYSYNPATQTPMQGRIECSKQLAQAAKKAFDGGFSFEWSIDPAIDSSSFCEENEEPWSLWECCMRSPEGLAVQSLHGIDFGRDGSPWSDPYRRVVEAELACEEFAK